MRRLFFISQLIVFMVILNGCMSSPARNYYQIYLSIEEGNVFQALNKTLLVDRVDVDNLYDDYRIVYRVSPYQLNFYSYEFWAEKPDKLVRDAITHYLLTKRVFQRIVQELSKGEPDLLLRSKIHAIEEVDTVTAWYARLAMEMEITDFKSGESIFFHHFDRREALPEKSVRMIPIVISQILREELEKMVAEIKRLH